MPVTAGTAHGPLVEDLGSPGPLVEDLGSRGPLVEDLERAARLRLAVGRLSRRLRTSTSGDLTPSQLSALVTVVNQRRLPLADLVRREAMPASSVSRVLAALAERGYVAREEHPDDRRAIVVAATDAGISAVAGIRAARTEVLLERLAVLTPEQRTALDAALPALEALVDQDPR